MEDLKRTVLVENISRGVVGYRSPITNMFRRWSRRGEKKMISIEELRDTCYTSGGHRLFKDGLLLVRDKEAREIMELPVLEEHLIDENAAKTLLNKSAFEIQQTLKKAPRAMKELVAEVAIEIELTDTKKMDAIREETDIDVQTILRNKREEAALEKAGKNKSGSIKPING